MNSHINCSFFDYFMSLFCGGLEPAYKQKTQIIENDTIFTLTCENPKKLLEINYYTLSMHVLS